MATLIFAWICLQRVLGRNAASNSAMSAVASPRAVCHRQLGVSPPLPFRGPLTSDSPSSAGCKRTFRTFCSNRDSNAAKICAKGSKKHPTASHRRLVMLSHDDSCARPLLVTRAHARTICPITVASDHSLSSQHNLHVPPHVCSPSHWTSPSAFVYLTYRNPCFLPRIPSRKCSTTLVDVDIIPFSLISS